MQDYYEILNVPRTASAEVIKKAYMALSLAWHPDKNLGNKRAEAKYKDITNAYDELKDPQKRREYDEALKRYEGEQDAAPFRPEPAPPRPQAAQSAAPKPAPAQPARPETKPTDEFYLPFSRYLEPGEAERLVKTKNKQNQIDLCAYVINGLVSDSYTLKENAKDLLNALFEQDKNYTEYLEKFDTDVKHKFIIDLLNLYQNRPSLQFTDRLLSYFISAFHLGAGISDIHKIMAQLRVNVGGLLDKLHHVSGISDATLIFKNYKLEVHQCIIDNFITEHLSKKDLTLSNKARHLILAGLSLQDAGLHGVQAKLSMHLRHQNLFVGPYSDVNQLAQNIREPLFNNLWELLSSGTIHASAVLFMWEKFMRSGKLNTLIPNFLVYAFDKVNQLVAYRLDDSQYQAFVMLEPSAACLKYYADQRQIFTSFASYNQHGYGVGGQSSSSSSYGSAYGSDGSRTNYKF